MNKLMTLCLSILILGMVLPLKECKGQVYISGMLDSHFDEMDHVNDVFKWFRIEKYTNVKTNKFTKCRCVNSESFNPIEVNSVLKGDDYETLIFDSNGWLLEKKTILRNVKTGQLSFKIHKNEYVFDNSEPILINEYIDGNKIRHHTISMEGNTKIYKYYVGEELKDVRKYVLKNGNISSYKYWRYGNLEEDVQIVRGYNDITTVNSIFYDSYGSISRTFYKKYINDKLVESKSVVLNEYTHTANLEYDLAGRLRKYKLVRNDKGNTEFLSEEYQYVGNTDRILSASINDAGIKKEIQYYYNNFQKLDRMLSYIYSSTGLLSESYQYYYIYNDNGTLKSSINKSSKDKNVRCDYFTYNES